LPVIPVLLDYALMPSPAQLPPDIQSLALRQAISLHTSSWNRDVARLTSALMSITGPSHAGLLDASARTTQPESAARRTVWARIIAWFR